MTKDKSIFDFIEKLKLQVNFNLIEIVDKWDADLCAVGFKRQDRLVYLSTYKFAVGKSDGYDYDFELYNEQQPENSNLIKEARNIREEECIADIAKFLDV
jgi:hypothetical protein